MGELKRLTSVAILGSLAYLSTSLPWLTGVVLLLSYLGLGGWHTLKLAIKTLPRDLRMIRLGIKLERNIKKWQKKTVSDLFSETVNRNPDKIAILFENECWTFRQLDQYANKVAHLFLEQGLKQGDTVAMFMDNCPEYIGLWLGLSKIGVRASFINYNLRENSLLHCINICKPKSIVYGSHFEEALKNVYTSLDIKVQNSLLSIGGDSLLLKSERLDKLLHKMSSDAPPPLQNTHMRDCLCFIYTSGTTGLPKAVPVRHMRFMFFAHIGPEAKITPDDIVYCVLPLYHSNGGILATSQMLIGGCTLAIRRKFSASKFWDDCIKYRCTKFFYIGEVCRYLLAQPQKAVDTKHPVTTAIGNGLRSEIWTEFQNRFNIPHIVEFYGSTEGNCSMINTTGKTGACGFNSLYLPLSEAILLKIDPKTGNYARDKNGFCIEAGVDEPGEAASEIGENAASTFEGYHDPEAAKKKILNNVFKKGDAYFLSGDLMRMDEEGYFYFCDRTGDTFRWKGENVSTTEVEGLISRLLDLRDAVVFGVDVPGADGKAGMACIVGDEESVDISGLAEKLFQALPAYAVPIFVRLIQQADLTGTFKLQKTRLRNEGYDKDKVSEPLYILDKRKYVPLDENKYQQLRNGQLRV